MRLLMLRIHRLFAETDDLTARRRLHAERSRLLHGLVDALGIDVEDWGETDGQYPREYVEIAVTLASAAVGGAVAEVVKYWLTSRSVREVELVKPDGSTISVRGMSPEERAALGRMLWSKARPAPAKRGRPASRRAKKSATRKSKTKKSGRAVGRPKPPK